METYMGLDIGNTSTKVCVSWPDCPDGLVAKIPSRYSRKEPPGQLNASGQRGRPKAFELIFSGKNKRDFTLWFGQDTLAIPGTTKLDQQKYNPAHIQLLFRGALAQWEQTHKRYGVALDRLGKINIVASMPPGLFEDGKAFSKANKAYRDAFNNPRSHLKIRRPGLETVQIVTKFDHLTQEAVAWGEDVPRKNESILVIDIGGGTRDWALFNGSDKPRGKGSSNTGLIHAYELINPNNPYLAELAVINDKKNLPEELSTYYNDVETSIQRLIRVLKNPVDRMYVIGGGAALMPPAYKAEIKSLAKEVYFKDEYANCRANWRKAGGK